jgi:hypothetical protein
MGKYDILQYSKQLPIIKWNKYLCVMSRIFFIVYLWIMKVCICQFDTGQKNIRQLYRERKNEKRRS